MPPIVLVITDGILAILVMNIKLESFKRVKGARYVKMSLGVPGIKKMTKRIISRFFSFFKNEISLTKIHGGGVLYL